MGVTFVVIARWEATSPLSARISTWPLGTAITLSSPGFSIVTSFLAVTRRSAIALGSNVRVAPLSIVTLPKAFPVFGSSTRKASPE